MTHRQIVNLESLVPFNDINTLRSVIVKFSGAKLEEVEVDIKVDYNDHLVFKGHPKDVYRTLLNAADSIRSTYQQIGMTHVLDTGS